MGQGRQHQCAARECRSDYTEECADDGLAERRADAAHEPRQEDQALIQLRDALLTELSSVSELCLRSKAVWGYDDAFMAACRGELTLDPDELQTTNLQVAERDAAVVGVVQVKVDGANAELLKLFVEPTLLGAGIGGLLLGWAT